MITRKNHYVLSIFLHSRTVTASRKFLQASIRRICNIIVLNVHAPSEEKSDNSKDSFYEELEQVFDHFPK